MKDMSKSGKNDSTGYLSSNGEYSSFSFRDRTITFYTGKNLKKYTSVKEWDKGYLVVLCINTYNPEKEEEDYIDLLPILKNLYIEPDDFLEPIREVEVRYA